MYHNVFLCLLEVCEGWLVGLDILVLSTVIRRILELKVKSSILVLWIWRKLLIGCQEK